MRARAGAVVIVLASGAVAGLLATEPASSHPLPQAPACPDLPADNVWHADVSALPLHPRSAAYVASMGLGRSVHADFGSGTWDGLSLIHI